MAFTEKSQSLFIVYFVAYCSPHKKHRFKEKSKQLDQKLETGMKRINYLAILAAVACFALSQSASADVVVYSENFEGGTAGGVLNTLAGWTGQAAGRAEEATIGSGTEFGASTQYLDMSSTKNGYSILKNEDILGGFALGSPITYSFDLYALDAASFTNLRFAVRGMTVADQETVQFVDIGPGAPGPGALVGTDWDFNTVTHFDIVANLTTAGDGVDGTTSAAAGTYSVFVDGNQTVTDNALFSPGSGGAEGVTAFIGFSFLHQSSATGTRVLIDNIQVSSAAVPEPSTFALIGLGSVCLIARRRR